MVCFKNITKIKIIKSNESKMFLNASSKIDAILKIKKELTQD